MPTANKVKKEDSMSNKNKHALKMPNPVLDEKEIAALETLQKRYERLIKQSVFSKTGKMVGNKAKAIVPKGVVDAAADAREYLNEKELIKQALKYATEGFSTLEEYAARATVDEKSVLKKINKSLDGNEISQLDEICFARSYEISKIVGNYKRSHVLMATFEGAVTGAFGFAGIVPNLVLSLFLFFRAVQSVAMYYGYDAKNDAAELEIASSVLMSALSPQNDMANNELTAAVGKFMIFTESTAVKQAAKKSWAQMIEHGGLGLMITQIRALANKAAQKALENAGKKGIENTIFKSFLTQLGKRLGLKNVATMMPIFGGAVGALFDTTQMKRIVTYADIFYNKRFIEEKGVRLNTLINPEKADKIEDVIDADFEIESTF